MRFSSYFVSILHIVTAHLPTDAKCIHDYYGIEYDQLKHRRRYCKSVCRLT